MDIDSMILKMTAASRLKVTKQEQSLQKLEWKQSAYRSVTTALMEFRDKYFNSLSATNFKSQSLFNTIRATLPTDTTAFTATATSSAVAGKSYVNSIQQLATSESITNASTVSTTLYSTAGAQFTDLADFVSKTGGQPKDFMLTLDGVSRTVVIDDAFVEDLKTIALSDSSATHHVANADAATIAAFDLSTVTDRGQQAEYLEDALQNRINALFDNPAGQQGASTSQRITVDANSSGSTLGVYFSAQDGSKLTIGYATAPAAVEAQRTNESAAEYKTRLEAETLANHKATGLGALGFADKQSNRLNIYSSIAELRDTGNINGTIAPPNPTLNSDGTASNNYVFIINDVRISVNEDESISSLMSKINASQAGVTLSYSEVTDKFTLTAKQQGTGENIVMGDTNGNLLMALGLKNGTYNYTTTDSGGNTISHSVTSSGAAATVYGQNAIAYIDGQKIERASNEFTVNGVAYSLKSLFKDTWTPQIDTTSGKVTNATDGTEVSLAADVTDLKEHIKNFVTDYNALVDLLYGVTNEEAYSDYEPLTEEERAAMSESQIKLWEEKAKSGILRNDSTINKIFSSMREAFLTSVNGFSLFNMGITYGNVNESWKSNGKLTISDEAKLQSALEANPDQVRDFFTNASKGVATKLDTIIDNAVRTTGGEGHRGSLIEIAGWPSTLSETENTLYTQILNHNKRITTLKEQLEKEESRLWTQFSAMEEALSKLNEQNSLISQYFGASA
jgi:flagellar hook-associated protein 2